jgi:hypothetical protein
MLQYPFAENMGNTENHLLNVVPIKDLFKKPTSKYQTKYKDSEKALNVTYKERIHLKNCCLLTDDSCSLKSPASIKLTQGAKIEIQVLRLLNRIIVCLFNRTKRKPHPLAGNSVLIFITSMKNLRYCKS